MIKKTAKSNKKGTNSTKKTTNTVKKTVKTAKKQPSAVKKNNGHDFQDMETGIDQQSVELLPLGAIEDIRDDITRAMNDFRKLSENNMNALQRKRKIGAGIRNYGFIEKVADLAESNPQFAQFFSPDDLRTCIMNFDMCREIVLLLQAFVRLVSNSMLVYSNEAYGMSLIFYNMVKEMSKRGNPKAMEIFRTLQPFFKKQRRVSAEPTEKEFERDLHALVHSKKDGKIVIENITPKLTGGVHKVVDDVYSGHAAVKESAEVQEN